MDERWFARLRELADAIRVATRGPLLAAADDGTGERLRATCGQGAGDVTFGLDVPSEELLTRWLDERAREGPLSLLTEDSGWRHAGPGPGGRPRELDGFDHGGPCIAVDPVDGTRNLMADLRSAWTVLAWTPPCPAGPRLADVAAGVVAEIPTSLGGRYRVLATRGGGDACTLETRELDSGALVARRALAADADDRVDHGYFPFFRYDPAQRPALAAIEADFFERLREHEDADLRTCFDDQYISNAGQLVHVALGVYRLVVDARGFVGARAGARVVTSKPYDVAGALACARAAGCPVTDPLGAELDAPLDASTPVSFVAYANEATRARIERHLRAALGAV